MINSIKELPYDDFNEAIKWILDSSEELSEAFIEAFDDKYHCRTWPVLKVHGDIYSLAGLKLLPKLMGDLLESIEFYHAKIDSEGLAEIITFCQMMSEQSISCKKILFYNCQMPAGLSQDTIKLKNLEVRLGTKQLPPKADDMEKLDLGSCAYPTERKKEAKDDVEQESTSRPKERSQTIIELLQEISGSNREQSSDSPASSILITSPSDSLYLNGPNPVTLCVNLVGEGGPGSL